MLPILSVAGCFLRANGGCQTPCLVISPCAVAETALASTPPSSLLHFDTDGGLLTDEIVNRGTVLGNPF